MGRASRVALATLFVIATESVCLGEDRTGDDVERQSADRVAEEGLSSFKAGEYEKALTEFEEAYQLFPEPSVLLELSRTRFKLGRCDAALGDAKKFVVDATRLKLPAREGEAWLASLEANCPTIRVWTDPPGAVLSVEGEDDSSFGVTPWQGRLAARAHHIVVSLNGYLDRHELVAVEAGKDASVVLKMARLGMADAAAAPSSAPSMTAPAAAPAPAPPVVPAPAPAVTPSPAPAAAAPAAPFAALPESAPPVPPAAPAPMAEPARAASPPPAVATPPGPTTRPHDHDFDVATLAFLAGAQPPADGQPAAPRREEPPQAKAPSTLHTIGWASLALASAAVVTAIGLGASVSHDTASLRSTSRPGNQAQQLINSINSRATDADIFFGLSGAAAAVGVSFIIVF